MSAPIQEIPWQAEYEVGIVTIDKQHQELVEVANEIAQAVAAGEVEGVGYALDYLLGYVKYHLGMEDEVMERTGYQGYAEHQDEHQRFTAQILKIRGEFDQGDPSAAGQAAQLLLDWLLRHIGKTDRQLADFLKERSSPEEAEKLLTDIYSHLVIY